MPREARPPARARSVFVCSLPVRGSLLHFGDALEDVIRSFRRRTPTGARQAETSPSGGVVSIRAPIHKTIIAAWTCQPHGCSARKDPCCYSWTRQCETLHHLRAG